MMDDAKKIYWGDKIDQSKIAMVLWTIIDGRIYREVRPSGLKNPSKEAGSLYDFKRAFCLYHWDLHLY